MPHNPNRLEVISRAELLSVAIHDLADRYRLSLARSSPGLRNQLLRAADSICLNLAEACGYDAPRKVVSFLDVAIGSCNEVERILRLGVLCRTLDASADTLIADTCIVRAMTYGFKRHIQRRAADERNEQDAPG